MRKDVTALLLSVLTVTLARGSAAQQLAPPDREITPLVGDLYRVREGQRYTVFLLTPDGIVMSDPLGRDTALWLKEEFANRFPSQPVRYVLHTSHRFERAEGATVFDAADRIGHRSFDSAVSESRRALDTPFDGLDRNHNNRLERTEWADAPLAPLIATRDRDGDGTVTAGDLYAFVADVRRTFDTQQTVTLGGRRVEILHRGSWNGSDTTVLYFPAERIAFTSDVPAIMSAPFTFAGGSPRGAIAWIRAIARLDVERVITGRGTVISGADLIAVREYLDALVDMVAVAHEEGISTSGLQGSPTLDRFRGQPFYPSRDAHLTVLSRTLRVTRVDVSGTVHVNYARSQSDYCIGFTTCTTGGAIRGGVAAATLYRGRLGAGMEVVLGDQWWSSRTRPYRDEEFAFRESTASALVRYAPAWRRGLTYQIVGGPTYAVGDARGMLRTAGAVAPLGGRFPIRAHEVRMGVTAGAELNLSLGAGLSLLVPVRVTRTFGDDRDTWPTRTTLRIGVGLSTQVFRRVH